MDNMMKRLSGLVLLLCLANFLSAQDMHMDTYCNPLNIDYTYMIYNSDKISPTFWCRSCCGGVPG